MSDESVRVWVWRIGLYRILVLVFAFGVLGLWIKVFVVEIQWIRLEF